MVASDGQRLAAVKTRSSERPKTAACVCLVDIWACVVSAGVAHFICGREVGNKALHRSQNMSANRVVLRMPLKGNLIPASNTCIPFSPAVSLLRFTHHQSFPVLAAVKSSQEQAGKLCHLLAAQSFLRGVKVSDCLRVLQIDDYIRSQLKCFWWVIKLNVSPVQLIVVSIHTLCLCQTF